MFSDSNFIRGKMNHLPRHVASSWSRAGQTSHIVRALMSTKGNKTTLQT